MKSIYGIYCPPLTPRYIREYLVDFWSKVHHSMKRRTLYAAGLCLLPRSSRPSRIKAATVAEKKVHLFNFLIEFARYHRDIYNALTLKNAMEAISIVTERKILQLSKGNQTLFEFLPAERIRKKSPVINHVIRKRKPTSAGQSISSPYHETQRP